ncbi:MAG: KH domain-containing protein [Clostridia bacterium]|nr:KH domain-containing protein [Clostridia bacterium]
MKELVQFLAKSLVDQPDAVQVMETEGPEAIILELSVAPEDMGKVIGKHGRIAKAIRTVVKAATDIHAKPVYVDIQK